jgi:importin-9
LVLQLIKTFSMLDGIQDEAVCECFDGTFELWMSIFISALQGSINLNINIKKYILKVTLSNKDFSHYLSRYAEIPHQ